jgi:hypothetical protein
VNSHEYAHMLNQLADFLLSRPEFETPNGRKSLYLGSYWDKKEEFLGAVRALGSGKKKWGDHDLDYVVTLPTGIEMYMAVCRSAVCRKVQEEKWECEPLLSPEEEASVGSQS